MTEQSSPSALPLDTLTLEMGAGRSAREAPRVRSRRRSERVRRNVLRLDVGLGLLIALAGALLAPGLALVAVAALLVLLVCVNSYVLQAFRARRR